MLYEIKNVQQNESEPVRRWFFDHDMDLLVWLNDSDEIISFQLCYDKQHNQHALTWEHDTGFHHNRVDEGDKIGRRKGAPILVSNGRFDHTKIAAAFQNESGNIPEWISRFVYEKITAYG